jgi:type VI secretion system protein ImpH
MSEDAPATARDSFLNALSKEPWRFDFYTTLRRFERDRPDIPRIGDAGALRDEHLRLGHDPYFAFPASTFAQASETSPGRWRLIQSFLGLMGPQGALPLSTTEEAFRWQSAGDDAFSRFVDLFNHRFTQLFFRAWADARPIAHADRPKEDRFRDYVGSAAGFGQNIFHDADLIPDAAKTAFSGLIAPKAKSASRLRRLIRGLFGVDCRIEEFVGVWLQLEPVERSRLDGTSTLGVDLMAGGSYYSISDKIRLQLLMRDLDEYERYLPGTRRSDELCDLVFLHLGEDVEWEVELALPAREAPAATLGVTGRLGWTGWMGSDLRNPDDLLCDARFSPAEARAVRKGPARKGAVDEMTDSKRATT